jgi:hypothetical protein
VTSCWLDTRAGVESCSINRNFLLLWRFRNEACLFSGFLRAKRWLANRNKVNVDISETHAINSCKNKICKREWI